MTTKNQYIDRLSTLVSASIPLVVTKTREPYQAMSAIGDFVYVYNQKVRDHKQANKGANVAGYAFGKWTTIHGWTIKTAEAYMQELSGIPVAEEPRPDNNADIIAAFDAMLAGEEGIYAMNWPHPAFESPLVKAYLLDIAHQFTEQRKRLILVLPEIAEIPAELQDYVSFLDYEVPSENERLGIIRGVYEAYGLDTPSERDQLLISSAGAGMTGFELGNCASRAIKTLQKQAREVTSENVSQLVLEQKTEMVQRTEVLEVLPKGSMGDIGGLENLKEWIAKRKHCFSAEAAAFGVDTPKGIALGGPPGTGKSACAKAIGHELDLPVIKFDVSSVFNALVGSSEARARQALKLIEAMAPCVALLDEVDKAFDVNSGSGDSGVGKRILGQILTFLQESKKPIFWIMTFNRAEGLPPELLRKGRLDEVFAVTTPQELEREDIFKIHLRKRRQEVEGINLRDAVKASDGFVPAELEAAVKEAIVEAFHRNEPVSGALIAEQFNYMNPLSKAFSQQFKAMEAWATNNARSASKLSAPAKTPRKKVESASKGRQVDDLDL